MFELLKKETLRIVEKLGLQESDFECQFIKGFGKGGQKKNKTNNFTNIFFIIFLLKI